MKRKLFSLIVRLFLLSFIVTAFTLDLKAHDGRLPIANAFGWTIAAAGSIAMIILIYGALREKRKFMQRKIQ